MTRQHIVFLTGAGVSVESGLNTFRGKDGLWTNEEWVHLASTDALYNETEKCLDFYNLRRKQLAEVEPNDAHRMIAELEKKPEDDYKDKWMRSVAEFDNYKKRNAHIRQEAYADGKADIIIKVLAVGDNLERALAMVEDEKTKEGLALVLKQYDAILKDMGVEEINPIGEKFDPNLCEAVMQVEGEEGEESDTVKSVFLKGFKLGEKIIRYAKVSVVK